LTLREPIQKRAIHPLCVGAERPHDATDAAILGQADLALPLLRPQLGESKTQQRQSAAITGVAGDQVGEPGLIVHTAYLGRLSDHPLHSVQAHRRQGEQTVTQESARVRMFQQLGEEVSPHRAHQAQTIDRLHTEQQIQEFGTRRRSTNAGIKHLLKLIDTEHDGLASQQ